MTEEPGQVRENLGGPHRRGHPREADQNGGSSVSVGRSALPLVRWARVTVTVANLSEAPTSSTSSSKVVRVSPSRVS